MPTLEEQFTEATVRYTHGDYAGAKALLEPLAKSGHAKATTYLAELHLHGHGVPRDPARAVELLEQAVIWGDATAAWNLGAVYQSGGFGVPRNPALGRQFMERAAEMGYPYASGIRKRRPIAAIALMLLLFSGGAVYLWMGVFPPTAPRVPESSLISVEGIPIVEKDRDWGSGQDPSPPAIYFTI